MYSTKMQMLLPQHLLRILACALHIAHHACMQVCIRIYVCRRTGAGMRRRMCTCAHTVSIHEALCVHVRACACMCVHVIASARVHVAHSWAFLITQAHPLEHAHAKSRFMCVRLCGRWLHARARSSIIAPAPVHGMFKLANERTMRIMRAWMPPQAFVSTVAPKQVQGCVGGCARMGAWAHVRILCLSMRTYACMRACALVRVVMCNRVRGKSALTQP
jgi:hypothetical protein